MRRHSTAVFAMAMTPFLAAAQQFVTPAAGAPIDPTLRFEVVSLKRADDTSAPTLFRMTPAGFESSNLPIGVLLRQSLQKPDYQILGAPGWIDTDRYTVRAKPPEGAPPAAMSVLLSNLLKDRFQLATHVETREQAVFHLVTARTDGRLGSDLNPTSAECQATLAEAQAAAKRGDPPRPLPGMPGGPPLPDPNGPLPCGFGRITPGVVAFSGRTVAQLIPTLSDLVARPVIDKTGLTGLYDFSRGPVEVAVVDRLEKPTLD